MAENEAYRTVTRLNQVQSKNPTDVVATDTTKYRYSQIPGIGYEHEDTGLITANPFQFEKWLDWVNRTRL